jgi:DNA-binding NtrC family response regulator
MLLWSAVLLYFYASGRIAAYLPPDGIFRQMVLISGIGLAVVALFNMFTTNAEDALVGYRWPGNIRELKNTIWRAAILAEGQPIEPVHLGLPLPDAAREHDRSATTRSRTLQEAEWDAIRDALAESGGNRTHAARLLGIARSTLLEKLKRDPRHSA